MLNTPDASAAMQEQPAATQIRFQPTLFIYLGTSSGQIAWRLKKLLREAYGNVPVLRHLWVDIDTDVDPQARPHIADGERVELSGFNPAAVARNVDNYPALKEWWSTAARIPAGMLAGGGSPQQMRLVGRMALFRMFTDRTRGSSFISRLTAETEALFSIQNWRATEAMSTPAVQYSVEQGCRVVMVFSPSGGTGSSLSFDVAYLCRHLLAGRNPTVISVSILPGVIDKAIREETEAQKEKVRANTYAWFKEDNYLNENPYWNVTYPDGVTLDVPAPPFSYRFVVDIGNQAGYRLASPDDVFDMVARAVFLDTGSSIAGAMRGFTANVGVLGEQFEGATRLYSSLAAASLIYPKQRLLQYCSSRMGRALLAEGLLANPDAQQVKAATATVLSQLRLRDADLLADLMKDGRVRMHHETAITKAKPVSAALTQLDAQERENNASRSTARERLAARAPKHQAQLKAGLDAELAHLAANQGFLFARAVLDMLLEPAPEGAIKADAHSFDSLKVRIAQQGAGEDDLQEARDAYDTARTAVKRLDDGIEDKLERAFSLASWNQKFVLFKRNAVTAMARVNDVTLDLAAQQQAASIYDYLASAAKALRDQLDNAATALRIQASELQAAADNLDSHTHGTADVYEFQQEIEVNFADYYYQHTQDINVRTAFANLIPAKSAADIKSLVAWTGGDVTRAATEFASQFFVERLNATSLLSTLQDIAEKRGMPADALVKEELDRLVKYCHPFWQYDHDRGVSDLEGKSIIGVEDENSPLIPAGYRTDTLYEIKTTGFRDRIDVVRIQHGLPAFLLRGMDQYKAIYDKRRTGRDPLHILPDMDLAPDLMPERGKRGRELFAIGLAFDFIVQLGSWYYFDPERDYQGKKIQPARKYRLAQGREKSEDEFARKDEFVRQVDQAVEAEVRAMGNEAANKKLDKAIEAHQKAIAKMPAGDESLRQQYEKEIQAIRSMQRRLGRVG